MADVLTPQVSIIKNLSQVIKDLPIEEVIQIIQSDRYKDVILKLRKLKGDIGTTYAEQGNLKALVANERQREKDYKIGKERLPAFIPMGTFEGGTKAECFKTYSGIVVLDIDKLKAEEVQSLKLKVQSLKFTYACFVSPSGLGVKVLVRVDSEGKFHRQAYYEVKEYYEKQLNVSIDKSGVNINRLCFFSWDPEVYFNPDSEIFKTYIKMLDDDILKVVSQIEEQGIDLTAYYPDWHKICLALISALGENGRDYFHRISRFYQNYNSEECEKLFNDCLKYGSRKVTIKTFFWYAQQAGIDISPVESVDMKGYKEDGGNEKFITQRCTEEGQRNTEGKEEALVTNVQQQQVKEKISRKDAKTQSNLDKGEKATKKKGVSEEAQANDNKVEEYLMKEYDFRYNEITGRTEIMKKGVEKFVAMTDFMLNSIHRELVKNKIKCSVTGLRNKFCSDFCKTYNPIKEYFMGLGEWDNKDYIKQLARTIKTNDDKLFYKYLKKWLVAVVACALDPNVTNQTCLVIVGKQGVGKTSWLLRLIPHKILDYHFSGTLNPSDKDTMIHLSECLLINLDELENMNRTEIGTLKEIITKTFIRLRRPYGYNAENLIRRASFMGSVNSAQFLNDPTGSRRFLCFTVENIKLKQSIDIDRIWSEAYALYRKGFKYWFDKSEIDEINQLNEQYQWAPMEEEMLLKYFEAVAKEKAELFLSASDILKRIRSKTGLNFTTGAEMKLGKALKKHGFERVKKGGIYKWAVKELIIDEQAITD